MSIIWIILGEKQRTKHTIILSRVCFAMQHMLMMLQNSNNEQEVVTNANGSRSSSNKQKRKCRNQWTLLHSWAYVTKSLLGDDNTFFSILIDESTDRTLEREPHCKFVWLLLVENVKVEGIYNSINEFILESNLDFKKLVYRYISCLCFGLKNINTIFILCISLSLWGSYVYLCIFVYFL